MAADVKVWLRVAYGGRADHHRKKRLGLLPVGLSFAANRFAWDACRGPPGAFRCRGAIA